MLFFALSGESIERERKPASADAPADSKPMSNISDNVIMNAADSAACLLVLVCRGARPSQLVEHLYALAQRRGVPCLTLPLPSTALGHALGLKTCMAVAVRTPATAGPAAVSVAASAASVPTALAAAAGAEGAVASVAEQEEDFDAEAVGRLLRRFVSDVRALPQNGL